MLTDNETYRITQASFEAGLQKNYRTKHWNGTTVAKGLNPPDAASQADICLGGGCISSRNIFQMEKNKLKTIDLKNGLKLEILDDSRQVAGDRWQVVATFRVNIPVKMLSEAVDPLVKSNVDEINSTLGENVCFEQKRVRNFIAENQKDDVLNGLMDSFVNGVLDYVSNPDFPKRYILRQHRENLRRKSWYGN